MNESKTAKPSLNSATVSGKYVSRGGDKLASVAGPLQINFRNKIVLDVGSSTGGFTQYALINGAQKVISVDRGKQQMNPLISNDPRVELHEKTDIRNFACRENIDIVLIDVSFNPLAAVLPAIIKLAGKKSEIIALAKPQFEVKDKSLLNSGVVKNERIRRTIFKDLENSLKEQFLIIAKAESQVLGSKGNKERFYKLRPLK